jgi:hypothetical protein
MQRYKEGMECMKQLEGFENKSLAEIALSSAVVYHDCVSNEPSNADVNKDGRGGYHGY